MEKRRPVRKNLLVIALVIVLIGVAAVVAATQKRTLNPTLGELDADPAQTAEATALPGMTADTAVEPAKAYLVVTVAGAMYEPIPLNSDGRYTVTRGDMINVIEVTPDSVRMHESSCDNQDCVEQGLVTLKNRDERVLQNMIICLPNEVVLELYTPEEIAQLLLSMAGYTGEETHE